MNPRVHSDARCEWLKSCLAAALDASNSRASTRQVAHDGKMSFELANKSDNRAYKLQTSSKSVLSKKLIDYPYHTAKQALKYQPPIQGNLRFAKDSLAVLLKTRKYCIDEQVLVIFSRRICM